MSDDTAFLKQWIDQQSEPDSPHMDLPPGHYKLSETLDVVRTEGVRLSGPGGMPRSLGSGWDNHRMVPVIEWVGQPGKPMIHLRLSSGAVIEGIALVGPADTGIQINHNGGALHFHFANLLLKGQTAGIAWGTEPREHTCADVTYTNCVFLDNTACVQLNNEQSLQHLFIRPEFNRSEVAINAERGGDVSILGGGSYELGTLLRLGVGGSNVRGFDVSSFRFDSSARDKTRTAWLDFDGRQPRTVGPISFRNCTLVNNSRESNRPLLTIVPGAHVVLDACTVNDSVREGNLAHILSTYGSQGTLVVRDCDGFGALPLLTTVLTPGPYSYVAFERTGGASSRESVSTFPDDQYPAQQLTQDDVDLLQRLLEAARGEE